MADHATIFIVASLAPSTPDAEERCSPRRSSLRYDACHRERRELLGSTSLKDGWLTMIANGLVLSYLLFMVYWWGLREGAFSAWLQLMITIAAGALALAAWEPTVLGFWMRLAPTYAWGVGLGVGFLFWLVLLRKITDWLVKEGVRHHHWVDHVAGGCFGLGSGILSAGITLVGIGFLPLPADAGGCQRLAVDAQGRVVENEGGQLWLPVDGWAIGFYERLSGGSFFSGYPLSRYQPDLATQAALYRLRVDPNSSVIATPDEVKVSRVYRSSVALSRFESPSAAMDLLKTQTPAIDTSHVVVVQTHWLAAGDEGESTSTKRRVEMTWELNRGTYDLDGALRVSPTQVRLITTSPQGDQALLQAPIGWVDDEQPAGEASNDSRRLTLFDTDTRMAYADRVPAEIGWVFIVPEASEIQSVLVRHLRLRLPRAVQDPSKLIQALGRPAAPAEESSHTKRDSS